MFGGHLWIIVVLVLAAIALIAGPRLLPRIGKRLGRSARDLKDAGVEGGANFVEEVRKPPEKSDSSS